MKKITKILAIVLALLMVLPVLAACKENDKPSDDPNNTKAPGTTDEPGNEEAKEYTYRLAMAAAPDTWNPHTWEMNNESELMTYIEGIPVDVTMGDDGYYEWVYEMVTAVTDVSASWDKAQDWLEADEDGNYPEDGTGYIYEIKLNPDAKWEDGTPINADTYIYSMERCISSEMKNYRANSYTTSESAIKNALKYYNNDLDGQPIYTDAAEQEAETYYVHPDEICVFFGDTAAEIYKNASYKPAFIAEDETDMYKAIWGRKTDDKQGYIAITEDDVEALTAIAVAFGDNNPEAWKEFCFVESGEKHEAIEWSEVGLIKGDEYTIYYVLEQPESMFYFLTSLTSGWIVNKELYEAGYKQVGDLLTTNYGTGVDNYSASGPYKMVSFEAGKAFILERNENWFGWTDGKHEGQYQATRVHYDIVEEQTTQLLMFNQGSLDEVALTADDMTKYRTADRLLKTDQTYTYRYIFATDLDALKTLEQEANDGNNKAILYYDEFRQAISLSINRQELCADCTPGYKPAFYLLNSLYYYNVENDAESRYRDTDAAKEAVLRIYDVTYGGANDTYKTLDEAYDSITGYDVQKAKDLFQAAVDKAIADGNYTAGQKIALTCSATAGSLTTDYTNENQKLNDYIKAATEGIENIGEIEITYRGNVEQRYADVAAGKVEMARGAWGGAAFYPFSTIRVYCEPDYMGGMAAIHESCGFNPTTETVDIPINGETLTKTYQDWAKSLNGAGEYADADAEIKLIILSYLESSLVKGAHMIPIACDANVGMYSYKIEYATYEYDIMYGYGGVRLMKFNYDDKAWDEFVASENGELDYT